ncbi:Dolichyl-diphosphooligosaccharide-protein glycosyltransferase subunit dad1 [Emydomyces testavorans]|uniref:DASH complex subunit DAD1 n=1 Tax=Emydomyces testavorans TaxID=2070801 RepID=A0AAF0DGJ7_9EURO|nr:Dolichyl-diphosphooligosaccharide-protein glycosyltransferase subunit dad1 [Emydomyces testavorans]
MASSESTSTASYFEQQREELLREISLSFEQVLQNINRLNRNLESVIAVGNEFSSVEALWSQFETVMGKDAEGNGDGGNEGDRGREGDQNRGGDEVKGGENDDGMTVLRDEDDRSRQR